MVIGLTGIFGSGKSAVLRFFRRRGASTISADSLVHVLLRQENVKQKITAGFGPGILNKGKIDRPALAKIVFRNNAKRKILERILHPLVKARIKKKIESRENPPQSPYLDGRGPAFCKGGRRGIRKKLVVVEVPLLFESGFTDLFDYTICVSAPAGTIRERMQKKGFSEAEIEQRWAIQWRLSEKEKKSDSVIDNSGSLFNTKKQVDIILEVAKGRTRCQR
ncbi:MAG: dephospho-CoA kinase [Candidatus Omnitrophota bacterium]